METPLACRAPSAALVATMETGVPGLIMARPSSDWTAPRTWVKAGACAADGPDSAASAHRATAGARNCRMSVLRMTGPRRLIGETPGARKWLGPRREGEIWPR